MNFFCFVWEQTPFSNQVGFILLFFNLVVVFLVCQLCSEWNPWSFLCLLYIRNVNEPAILKFIEISMLMSLPPCSPWDRWPSSDNLAAASPSQWARPSLGWASQPGCSLPKLTHTSPHTGTGWIGWSEGLGNKRPICPPSPTHEGIWGVK